MTVILLLLRCVTGRLTHLNYLEKLTADLAAGFQITASVLAGASMGSTIVNALDLAVIIPLMFGIRKSFLQLILLTTNN
jgi:hypothetical protein